MNNRELEIRTPEPWEINLRAKAIDHCVSQNRLEFLLALMHEWQQPVKEIQAMRALESLTLNGSEFVGDIERCVAVIRQTRRSLMDQLLKVTKQRNALLNAANNIEPVYAEYIALKPDPNTPSFEHVQKAVRETRKTIEDAESGQVTNPSEQKNELRRGVQLGLDRARRAIRAQFKPEEGTYHPLEIIIMYEDEELQEALLEGETA